MPSTLPSKNASRHAVLPDIAGRHMAKANVRKADIAEIAEGTDWMRAVGRAVERAVSLVGWSLKEVSDLVKVDEREVAKWFTGDRRPQFDRLFAIEQLREPLVVCLAELVPHARVSQRIEFERPAVNA